MKKHLFFGIVIIGLMIALMQRMKGAVTVQDITVSQFNALTSTYNAAWSVVFRGGGGVTEEMRLARNTATPQIGGGANTLIGQFAWSDVNDLEISIDSPGNISARANSITIGTLPIARPFNQILIFIHDENLFDATHLTGIDINTFATRNMSVDGFGSPGLNDVISVTGFGSQAPFTLNAIWDIGMFPGNDDQYVSIIALQNTTIPEPASFLLVGVTSFAMLRRRR